MSNTAPIVLPLNKLLDQSLLAAARKEVSANEAVAHLTAILSRIAGFFRNTERVGSQIVIEPAAQEIEIEGRTVRAPRLIAQCRAPGPFLCPALTIFYTPTSAKRIALRIEFGDVVHSVRDDILWTSQQNWSFPSLDSEVDAESHAKFLGESLYEAGLFSASAMTLEPLGA